MGGQGSPNTSRRRLRSSGSGLICWVGWLVVLAVLCAHRAIAAEETLRLRIAWGGGEPTLWRGEVAVAKGTLLEARPLGIEADEPGSMWLARGPDPPTPSEKGAELPSIGGETSHLVIRPRSPRTYDGVDLVIRAPAEAELLIRLSKPQREEPSEPITIPLAELREGHYSTELDDQGNWLSVRRTPDDLLRVALRHGSLVFGPGETLEFELEPCLLPVEDGTKVGISVELAEGRASDGKVVGEHDIVAGERVRIEQEVLLPEEEGVYDVVLRATCARWSPAVPAKQTLAVRRIQLVVLRPEAPEVPVGEGSSWSQVVQIDPANPNWWERLATFTKRRRISELWQGPLGNGKSRTWQHSLGELVQLGPSAADEDPAWEAYRLPIGQPGRPHILEIEYPGDVPQTMGISIIEPNAAGAALPIGLDSGVEVTEEVAGRLDDGWQRQRLLFWPKTDSPMVLITNRREGSPAVYGKIRVLSGGEHLPRRFSPEGPQPERLLGAYLDRPLFPENFSASQCGIASSKLGVDDWVTFYEGGTRLVEYLNHVGFGGLMISVLADGSTIYPSRILGPTPRYDTGVFLDEGQDPIRKDVLEMLLRLFDREGLVLIPAMEFAAPLPQLEAELRGGTERSEGMQWVGKDGKTWLETHRPVRGMAPYYNILHGRVQETVLAAIREVLGRYGHHRSFGGLAIQLSAHGYAQLPGPKWGMDDLTIARFERDTGVDLPGTGPERLAQRAGLLASSSAENAPIAEQWLRWRAGRLNRFYRQIQKELAAYPDARLYLAGANMLAGKELQEALRPRLPRRMTVAQALLRVGIDLEHYAGDGGVIVLRPDQIAPERRLAREAVDLEIRQTSDIDRAFEELPVPGSLFFHEPQELRLASFDQKSPFRPSYTWLITQPVPSGWQNRRRFVHSLAGLDSQAMFDGGWELSMSQEESLARLVATYRRLPAVRFQRLVDQFGSDPAQPVTIRYGTCEDGTYVYLVNDAPFETVVRVEVAAPSGAQPEELSGLRQVAPLERSGNGTYWTVRLEPYDLVAVRFSAPGVRLSGPRAFWSREVQADLEARIDDLNDRVTALRSPPVLDVLENADFEGPPDAEGRIAGWTTWSQAGATVELDTTAKWGGSQSVKMAGEGRGPVASLISDPFDAPSTGRLAMVVQMRGAPGTSRPHLRYVLEGQVAGERFVRWQTRQVGEEWEPFVVQLVDLPLEGLSQLRVRFDLIGPGEVWIDDVQLCRLYFSPMENTDLLMRLITPAQAMLEEGHPGDCIHLLEGYWPRFLQAHVPLAAVARKPRPTRQPDKEPERSSSLFDRMKSLVPRQLRWF